MTKAVDELLDWPISHLMDMREAKNLLLARAAFLKALTQTVKADKILSKEELDAFRKAFPEAYKQQQEFWDCRDAQLREQVHDGFKMIAVIQHMMGEQACQLILRDLSLFTELQEVCTKFLSACNDGFQAIQSQDFKKEQDKVDPLAEFLAELDKVIGKSERR